MQQNDTARMGTENIMKLMLQFSLPSTVGMVVMATYNIMDTFFIGMLGSEAIAALTVAHPIQMLLGSVAIGTGVGAASLISRSLGSGDNEEAEKALGQVIGLSIIYSIIVFVGGLFVLEPILVMAGATPEILPLAWEYIIVITSGSIMFFLLMGLNNVLRAEGSPILSMKVMIVSAVVNIILDPIFIFLFGLGVQGAAVATVLAKVAGIIIIFWRFLGPNSVLKLRLKNIKPTVKTVLEIYRIGVPAMVLPFSINISHMVANSILAGYGHVPVAVMGLFFRLQMLAIMPAIGFKQGLLPLIGYNYGAGYNDRIREVLVKGVGISTLFITVFGAAYFISPGFFLGLFTTDPELLELGTGALRIMVIMFPLLGLHNMASVYFQAVGKGLPSLFLSLLREAMLFIPIVLLLSNIYGLEGVWFSRPLSDFLAFIVTGILVLWEFKLQKQFSIKRNQA
ncbi:MATE family efflux transporter [Natranaerofaba carboxydovora]|uniref:MATE family efflux transporter n=1 Tax=Natranaerofaba carboxydovora TaxID=2742683 RepID=UPI001F137AA4|nr:MATE family efflux transporter [Natranaerofaba carboxydovora]UMZ74460.1 Multidrug export protein MepA [Natranaerofaba carboxydovora]